jgi:hypothetical protein
LKRRVLQPIPVSVTLYCISEHFSQPLDPIVFFEFPPRPTAPTIRDRPRLLDRPAEVIRVRHRRIRTERAHVEWVRRSILFQDKRHPAEIAAGEVEAHLSYPESEKRRKGAGLKLPGFVRS